MAVGGSGFMRCKHRLAYEAENPLLWSAEAGGVSAPGGRPYRRMPGEEER